MQALIEFLSSYEPLYRTVVKGYDERDVARFEQALGRPVPPAQRNFLLTAAANVGFLLGELTFDIDELIYMAEFKRPMLERMSGLLTPFAWDLSASHSDFYIYLGRPAEDGDGEIVRSASGGTEFDDIHVAPSIRDMLFYSGFQEIRMLPLIHKTDISWHSADFPKDGPTPTLAALHSLLEQLGFRSLGVTGPAHPLYERDDCAATARKNWNSPMIGITLAAKDERTLDTIAEILIDNIPGKATRRLPM
ncbi:MAG: hypothetical protein R6X02_10810 [Enhygromyxa sp.]